MHIKNIQKKNTDLYWEKYVFYENFKDEIISCKKNIVRDGSQMAAIFSLLFYPEYILKLKYLFWKKEEKEYVNH